MNLQEFTSGAGVPQSKPWLTHVAQSIEVVDATVRGNLIVKGGSAAYGLWATLALPFTTSSTTLVDSMNLIAGRTLIPASELIAGRTVRIRVGGVWSTAGVDSATLVIRNSAGLVYSAVVMTSAGALVNVPWTAEFDIQVQELGVAGDGDLASAAIATFRPTASIGSVANARNITTIDTTIGVDLKLYMNVGAGTSSITRNIGTATVVF